MSKRLQVIMPRKRLSKEARQKIIKALQANANAAQVARETGDISAVTVWGIAKAERIELKISRAGAGRKPMPANRRKVIVAALRANPNAKEVAREIGCGCAAVGRIAKASGIKLRRKGTKPIPPNRRKAIIAALRANPNAKQVARELGGVCHVSVWKIARAEGIELTASRPAKNDKKRP
jgi:hypothetical protein